MKLFALLAILFFAYRAFSEEYNYFYVDEYIRSQEDPDFYENLKKRQEEQAFFRNGVEDYKDQKFYDELDQEESRQAFVSEKKKEKSQYNHEKEYEAQKQKDHFFQLEIEKRYAQEKTTHKNSPILGSPQNLRSIASFDERKRIPKKNRKYQFKKSPR